MSAAPAHAAGAVRATTSETSFAILINAERRRHGLKPLRVVSDLTRVARSWSATMANAGDIWHNPRLTRQAGNWRSLAENVGVGYSTRQLHLAFMGSLHHRQNILSKDYTEVGIGVARRNGRMYVTEDFRRPYRTASSTVIPTTAVQAHVVTASLATASVATPSVATAGPAASPLDAAAAFQAKVTQLAALEPRGASDPLVAATGYVSRMVSLTV